MMPSPIPHPLAFPAVEGPLFALDEEMLRIGHEGARLSPRRRIILPLHRTQDSLVQRMLNFMQPGTYARPHLHPRPGAAEAVLVLRGAVDFFRFDAQGTVLDRVELRPGGAGLVDIEARVWHTFATLAPDTVVLEVKMGPYDAKLDKVFPEWAPDEGSPESGPWMERLLASTPVTRAAVPAPVGLGV